MHELVAYLPLAVGVGSRALGGVPLELFVGLGVADRQQGPQKPDHYGLGEGAVPDVIPGLS